jgi:sugar lactone lactonase YvrE
MKTLNRIGLAFLFLTQLSLSSFAQSGGVISSVAGNGTQGFSGDGGPATSAQVNQAEGLAVDSAGNLYIADTANNRIRKVTPAGVISTVAGNGKAGFSGDGGPAISAQLYDPSGVAVDSIGNLYIADFNNRRIRKMTPAGVISTVAGNGGILGASGDGGPATSAALSLTIDVEVDKVGNLYFSEFFFAARPLRVRKVTPEGVISTVAGGGTEIPGDGGPATSAQLTGSGGVAVDSAGNLYIADNARIRKVTPDGMISTVAGNGTAGYSGDGGLATSAQLMGGGDVAVDPAGNLYVGDVGNNRIRKVTPDGMISTVAGNGTSGYGGDGGPATSAQLNFPNGVTFDSAGSLYIADTGNSRIRKVESAYTPQTGEVFVPIVLSSGGMNGSFYTSEMTLTNRGTSIATVNFTYTAALGSGSGTGMDTLAPGEQKIVPDAISYLRGLGVPIDSSGNQGGTLRVSFSGLASPSDGSVTVRTTTVVPEGRAGLAYAGIPVSMALTGPSYICGLRQNETDSSNVAVQNVGTAVDGNITLQLTVFSGEGGAQISSVLPDQVLAPGGFAQINGILASNGLKLSNGYVRVERMNGTAPYYAYGVINDQFNSDGSFILPVAESAMAGKTRMTLPVVVESGPFSTELVVTNWSTTKMTLSCRVVADANGPFSNTASFTMDVNPFQPRAGFPNNTVEQWRMIELSFTSTKSYANPVTDVNMTATFTKVSAIRVRA